jgi:hypothetical protein
MESQRHELNLTVSPDVACQLMTLIRPVSRSSLQDISSVYDGQSIDSVILGIAAIDKYRNVTGLVVQQQIATCSIVFCDKSGHELGQQQVALRTGKVTVPQLPEVDGYVPHLNQTFHCPNGATTAIIHTQLSPTSSVGSVSPAAEIDLHIVGGIPAILEVSWMETTYTHNSSEYVFDWSRNFRCFPKLAITLKDIRNNIAAIDADTGCFFDLFGPSGDPLIQNEKLPSSTIEGYALKSNVAFDFETLSNQRAVFSSTALATAIADNEEGEVDNESFRLVVRGVRNSTNETVFSFGNTTFKPRFGPQDFVVDMSIHPYQEPKSPSVATQYSIAHDRIHFPLKPAGMDYYWSAKAAIAFPEFIIHLPTEYENSPYVPSSLQESFTLECFQVLDDNRHENLNAVASFYTIQLNKAKNAIILRSNVSRRLDPSKCAQYCVHLTYKERRQNLYDTLQPQFLQITKKFSLHIIAADIQKIKLQQADSLRRFIFNGPNQDQRLVIENNNDVLTFEATDRFGNLCNFTSEDEICCFIRPKQSTSELVPMLQVTPNTPKKATLKNPNNPHVWKGKLTSQSNGYMFGSLSLQSDDVTEPVPDGWYELNFVYQPPIPSTVAQNTTTMSNLHLIYDFQYIRYNGEHAQRSAELNAMQQTRLTAQVGMETCQQLFRDRLSSIPENILPSSRQRHSNTLIEAFDLQLLSDSVDQKYQQLCEHRDNLHHRNQQRRLVRWADGYRNRNPVILPQCSHRGLVGEAATVHNWKDAKLLSFIAKNATMAYIVENDYQSQLFARADLKTYSIASTTKYYVNP